MTLALVSTLFLSELFAASAQTNVDANHCEVFVSRIGISSDVTSFDSRWVSIYLKVLNERIDGNVVEIGARAQRTVYHSLGSSTYEWQTLDSFPVAGRGDLLEIPFKVAVRNYTVQKYSNRQKYEVAFFLRTDKGTTYWVKDSARRNFIVDENTYKNAASQLGFDEYNHPGYAPLENSILSNEFPYYNPGNCY